MEYEVRVSESAERDIDEIFAYIAVKLANPQAASDWADELETRYGKISRHPFMYGLSSNETLRRAGYRRFVIKNYVVFYYVDKIKNEVVISRAFYARQNYEKYF